MVSYHITTRPQNPEDRDLKLHHRKDMESRILQQSMESKLKEGAEWLIATEYKKG